MKKHFLSAFLWLALAGSGLTQCDSMMLTEAGSLLNRDTFYGLREQALRDMDSCLWSMAKKGETIPENIPELFTLHAPDSSFTLYSYRFRLHSALHSYRAILIKQDSTYLLQKDSVVRGDLNKNLRYSQDDWYGAIYFNLIDKEISGKNYYFLFGYRDLDATENQKLIDVLWFDENGELQLGASLFDLPNFESALRFYFNYGEMGAAKLNYDPYENLILKDHLIVSVVNGVPVLLPDGSYEALEWKKKKWRYIEKVYNEVMEEAPRPVPLKRENKDLFGNDMKNKSN